MLRSLDGLLLLSHLGPCPTSRCPSPRLAFITPNKDALWNVPSRICAFTSWRALRLSCPCQFFLRAQLSYLSSENMSQPPRGRNDRMFKLPEHMRVSLEGTFDHTVAGQILCVSASGWLVSLQQGGQRFASCILCTLLDI